LFVYNWRRTDLNNNTKSNVPLLLPEQHVSLSQRIRVLKRGMQTESGKQSEKPQALFLNCNNVCCANVVEKLQETFVHVLAKERMPLFKGELLPRVKQIAE
jgi:hypothetical protein